MYRVLLPSKKIKFISFTERIAAVVFPMSWLSELLGNSIVSPGAKRYLELKSERKKAMHKTLRKAIHSNLIEGDLILARSLKGLFK